MDSLDASNSQVLKTPVRNMPPWCLKCIPDRR